jgi:hypothetical protein
MVLLYERICPFVNQNPGPALGFPQKFAGTLDFLAFLSYIRYINFDAGGKSL